MMISQTALLLRGGFCEEAFVMDDWSDETVEIMRILRDRPDLELPVLVLVLEQAAAAGIPVGDDLPGVLFG
jgi:hypothetical protein